MFKRILYGLYLIMVAIGLYDCSQYDDNGIKWSRVERWESHRLDKEEPIPSLSGQFITHLSRKHGFFGFPSSDFAYVIHDRSESRSYVYRRRWIDCDDGWYDRAYESDDLADVLGGKKRARRGTTIYAAAMSGEERAEFDYICQKYDR